MDVRTIGSKLAQRLAPGAKLSYAQSGEDLIVDYVFHALRLRSPSYLDIGAFAPVRLSNTFLFSRRGGRGVLVEPNPVLFEALRKGRPRDLCLNVGVGPRGETLKFYVLRPPTLSTFSEDDAKRFQQEEGAVLDRVLDVALVPLNELYERHFGGAPDFVSLDTEGLEYAILESADFDRFRPLVFCVETISYSAKGAGVKDERILRLMQSRGYMAYADTNVNTIFVDESRWRRA